MKKKSKPAKSTSKKTGFTPDDVNTIIAGIRKAAGGDDKVMLASKGMLDIKIRGVISSRCASLDDAIGRGGIPLGRLTLLHGAEASGKTTLALQMVAECQAQGGICVYIDAEHKLDIDYAKALGVQMDKLIMSKPDFGEEAFAMISKTIESAAELREKFARRAPILIVLDSMNAAITKAQYEGDWDDQHMAPVARMYSSLLPKLIPKAAKEDVALLFISQVRQKMNVTYGSPDEIAGGKAPPFYASLIVKVTRIATLKDGDVSVGNVTQAECKKNQIAPPFRKAKFVIVYGKGVDNERAIIELAAEKDLLEKKTGGWYLFKGERLGQGLGNCADRLRSDPELFDAIKEALRKKGTLSTAGDPYEAEEEAPKKKEKKGEIMVPFDPPRKSGGLDLDSMRESARRGRVGG